MCLTIVTKHNSYKSNDWDPTPEELFAKVVRVSNRDIKVWKRFDLARLHRWSGPVRLTTPYRGTKVALTGDVLTAKKFGVEVDSVTYQGRTVIHVEQGIHAYSDRQEALLDLCDDEIVLECTIPAGTPHAFGTNKEVVALQIIVPPVDRQSIKGMGDDAENAFLCLTVKPRIVQVK